MKKVPTIKDVAQHAGVSVATVSRVMNNKGYLSEEVKHKVNSAMQEIGYIPNQVARTFFNKKSNIIGVIVPTIKNPYFGELVHHIEKYAESKGYKILLCNSLNDPGTEKKYLQMLLENQVDGIIVGTHNEELEEYSLPNVPVIAVERFLDNRRIPTVCCDNYYGAKLAATYLVEKGCKDIVCFSGESKENYPANDRRVAFTDVMVANNLPVEIYDVHSFEVEVFQDTLSVAIDSKSKIDGIFATDDIIAISIMKELEKRGKFLGKDYYIVGFDGTELISSIFKNMPTIKQPIYEIAKYSVEHLISIIDGDKVPAITKLPVELINAE